MKVVAYIHKIHFIDVVKEKLSFIRVILDSSLRGNSNYHEVMVDLEKLERAKTEDRDEVFLYRRH